MRLAVLGGDQRQLFMVQRLAAAGHEVFLWGLGVGNGELEGVGVCEHWERAVRASDAVILPLPVSSDGVRIYCPLEREDVFLRISTLLDLLGDRFLLGGRFTDAMRSIALEKHGRWVDYFESEVLQLKNALPTAEAAISIAMRELPVTLDGCAVAVLGYGRIGSLLAEKLYGLGARVTVYARRSEQLALAALHHHAVVRLGCAAGETVAKKLPAGCRVIFNTVPQRIIGEDQLKLLPKNCILIDLASAPGGIDHNAAAKLGLKSIWATALPGRCTPESAGVILADVMEELLSALA